MTNKVYIRFKDIPEDEISRIYDGDLGCVGEELGVCCYECIEENGIYRIIAPSICNGVFVDLCHFTSSLLDEYIKCYLIEGDVVGTGTYNEPVVKNVKIIKELKYKELKDPKPKFKLDKCNPQLVEK